jgi:hypothetical protein
MDWLGALSVKQAKNLHPTVFVSFSNLNTNGHEETATPYSIDSAL